VELDRQPFVLQRLGGRAALACIARRQHDVDALRRELPAHFETDAAVAAGHESNTPDLGHRASLSCRLGRRLAG
jgi:hypothetical protein